jgi:hypothetical protein
MPNNELLKHYEYLIQAAADVFLDLKSERLENNPSNVRKILNRPGIAEILATSEQLQAKSKKTASDL